MRVQFDEYGTVLKKFVDYIESNEIIMQYICLGDTGEYDAKTDWDLVVAKEGYMFGFGPSVEEESFQIYSILKYINENIAVPYRAFFRIYREKQCQDNVKQFNDRVVLVLINNINDYLTGIGIDMGFDENIVWNVNGGQVNIASGNAIINATQNESVNNAELENIIKNIMDNVSGLDKEDADTIIDSVEMIREEIMKLEPKRNIISSGIKLLTSMISIANGIPALAENIQKFIDYVQL